MITGTTLIEVICLSMSIDNGENWEPVYRFKAGSIRHIHGITYDKWDDCFWICTGDHGRNVSC